MKRSLLSALILALALGVALSGAGCGAQSAGPRERVRIATTTSLYDTGLWSYLEPIFEKKYDVELDILYSGTGMALEYGRRGDVDAIAVHDREGEEQFIAAGYGLQRLPFAYNYFLIAGPPEDPAGIQGLAPEDAFRKLFETAASAFVSRGDESGTHVKEKDIWKAAGYDYQTVRQAGPWYIEAGRGMGPTLLMAGEKQGYTISDIGTFLAYKGRLALAPLVESGGILLNVYSVIAVDPARNPRVNAARAQDLVTFLTSPEVQGLIGEYGVTEYGQPLFTPWPGAEPAG